MVDFDLTETLRMLPVSLQSCQSLINKIPKIGTSISIAADRGCSRAKRKSRAKLLLMLHKLRLRSFYHKFGLNKPLSTIQYLFLGNLTSRHWKFEKGAGISR